jgi:hypothetical protein
LTLIVQADVLDVLVFNVPPLGKDGFAATKIDVGRCQIADTLVVATMVVVIDGGGDGSLEFPFKEVVFEGDCPSSNKMCL